MMHAFFELAHENGRVDGAADREVPPRDPAGAPRAKDTGFPRSADEPAPVRSGHGQPHRPSPASE